MTKYNNVKTKIHGITFDSRAEAEYYLLLKQLHKTGAIQSFRIQPRYLLQEAFDKNGKHYKKVEYVADFEVLHHDGRIEVVDVKGVETQVFKLKHKWFEKTHPELSLRLVDVNGSQRERSKTLLKKKPGKRKTNELSKMQPTAAVRKKSKIGHGTNV